MTAYKPAHEVEDIARDLIATVPMHEALNDVRIDFVWRPEAQKSKGRIVLGKARKISGLNAYLANQGANEDLFVVEIAADTWERLDDKQRRALVDHELCHCRVGDDDDGMPVLSIRGHDLEEFGCIVQRHGLWASNTAAFGSVVAEQLTLAVDEVTRFVEGIGNVDPGTGEIDPEG